MLKVVKFGGSSLASAEQFKKAASIVLAEEERRFVVPSAPGKRFSGDEKVTDLLIECYAKASQGQDIKDTFDIIISRYNDIIEGLELTDFSLDDEFDYIRSSLLHHAGRDYVVSRGEYLNGKILARYLGYDFIDANRVIFFNDKGEFDGEHTNDVLSAELSHHENAVIPGFYGAMPNDTIKTFSRGGSDITGSIVARAAQCDLYENWTDVSGFLAADPRIIDNPCVIDTITYGELRELSYMGATVLHEDAIFPVRFAGIPINIKNTNAPEDPGTLIVPQAATEKNERVITGIAGKKGFSVITLEKDMMNSEVGFGRRVLSVLEKENVNFEHMPSGIDTLSVIVNSSYLEGKAEWVKDELCKACEPETITIENDLALIAVVGRRMHSAKGTLARIITAISRADINIRMIDQGSSEMNIIVGVGNEDFEKSIKAIYNAFM